ncbi:MAG TPA: FxLYD domain-containing protein [Pyrinomonadaceae bacterium]|nr:FxLYD domain-containing protein [Pyrinomonadaceae bacterium]
MITPDDTGNNFAETDGSEIKRDRSPIIKIVSIILAVAVTATLLVGFLVWRKRHEESVGVAQPQAQAKQAKPALPAKVQIYMDEAVRKGSEAIIGGTVHNISGESLTNLSVEIELSHRKDAGTEVRSLNVEPKELAPDQKGRYSLTLTGDYRSFKLLRIKTASDEIGFKAAPGAQRPAERAPEHRTIIVNRPAPSKQGEEFINTPDNPSKIP